MSTAATENQYLEVRQLFSDYLEKNRLRKTQERFAILHEIYNRADHVDAETLYSELKEKKQGISRATVYNTLELLISCELITRHQFGQNLARYEKAHGCKQHDHLICVECKEVVEFCDPRIQQIQNMIGELLNFEITHHSLNLYGNCLNPNCQKRSRSEKTDITD